MNLRSLLNVSIKVIGIYYTLSSLYDLTYAIPELILLWSAWKKPSPDFSVEIFKNSVILNVFVPILFIPFLIWIVFKSEKIVNYLLKHDDTADQPFSGDISIHLLNISVKLFGLYSILLSISNLSEFMTNTWAIKEEYKYYEYAFKLEYASLGVTGVLYILAGVGLIYYSKPLSQVMVKMESEAGGIGDKEIQKD
jgi:hypothetical protein